MRKREVTEKEVKRAKMLKEKFYKQIAFSNNTHVLVKGCKLFNKVIKGEIKEVPVKSWKVYVSF